MPLFQYVGQHAQSGKKVKASIEADSLKDARLKIRRLNVLVLQIKEDQKASAAKGQAGLWAKLNRRPPRQEDLAFATKQFAILCKAGVDYAESLRSISEQVENEELQSVYGRIRELVSEGRSLSDAHREFPSIFGPIYVNMIAAAEKSGALPKVLDELSKFIYDSIELRRKVIGALTYPAFMLLVIIGVVIFLFVNVLPKITKALSSLRVTLPWYTVALNKISVFMQEYWLVSILMIVGVGVIFSYWARTPKGKYKLDRGMFNAAFIGPLMQRVAISRFAKTLSTVLTSGVKIVEGLQLTRNVVGNAYVQEAVDKAIVHIQDGDKLSAALEKTGIFPTMLLHMLRTGEKSGRVEELLVHISQVYDAEVDDKITSTTKAIQPIMTVFIAGIVGLVVIAVMGPMMQAMQSIK